MINNLVRSLKKRRISTFEKQDVDVEQQERDANPFGHLVENVVALKNIITPKKRKVTRTPLHRNSIMGTPSTCHSKMSSFTPNVTEFDKNLKGWHDLGSTAKAEKENGFFSPAKTPGGDPSTKKKSFLHGFMKNVNKGTPMSDQSDNLETFHSPINSPLQVLHQSPSSAVRSMSKSRSLLGVALTPKTTPSGMIGSTRGRGKQSYFSPRKSPVPKRLLFEDEPVSSIKLGGINDEWITEQDEYDFLSNEEKIASVFCNVKSPFETRMPNLATFSSPMSNKRKAPCCDSPVRAPIQQQNQQYPYSFRAFIGGAKDLIDTKVGFKRNPDPYVTLQIGQCRQNTPHVPSTRNPSFNQSFSFIVHSTRAPANSQSGGNCQVMHHEDPEMVIKVFDHDNIFAHAFMGKCVINLREMLEQCQNSSAGRSEVKTMEVRLSGEGIQQGSLQIVYDMSQGSNFKF